MQPDEYVLLGAALAGACGRTNEITLYAGACAAVRLIYAVYMHCCFP